MKLALKVRIDGTTEVMDISGNEIGALQVAVGGYVERVGSQHGVNLWMDEEGKLKSYRVNKFATTLYGRSVIVGDVVITGLDDEEGETLSLTDEQVDIWIKKVKKYYKLLKNNRIQDYVNPF